jgi:glucose-1-phosphate thymidylyltransferase
MPEQAIILAAGDGERIRPFTVNRPKAMLYIAGKPIIQHVIEALSHNGIRNIVMVVGHKKEKLFDYLGSGEALDVKITYVIQEQQLGSADALLQAQQYVDDDFLVLPGNKYFLAETLLPVINTAAPAMLVKRFVDPLSSSIVNNRNGKIDIELETERRVGPVSRQKGLFSIDTRIYCFDKNIFPFLEDAPSIYSAVSRMINSGIPVSAVETTGEWADMLYPWDILYVNESALACIEPGTSGTIGSYVSLRGKISVSDGCVIHPNCFLSGPITIARGCVVGPNVCMNGPVSIGANTSIEPFSYISNCVIGSNVHIAPGAIIQDSVIDDNTIIGARFTVVSGETDINIGQEIHCQKIGVMIGEGCRFGTGVTTQPGTIIGNFCTVQNLRLLSGNIPDKSLVV